MITLEAIDKATGKKLDSLCLTDPHDGGSRERNRQDSDTWKAKVAQDFPEQEIQFACYLD